MTSTFPLAAKGRLGAGIDTRRCRGRGALGKGSATRPERLEQRGELPRRVTASVAVGGGALRFSCVCHARADRVTTYWEWNPTIYPGRMTRFITKELSASLLWAVALHETVKVLQGGRHTSRDTLCKDLVEEGASVGGGVIGTRTARVQIFPTQDASRRCCLWATLTATRARPPPSLQCCGHHEHTASSCC